MNLVILLTITAYTFIPSLLPGLKAKEIMDSEQLTAGILYGDLLEELKGAHLRIAATHIPPAMMIEKNSDGTFRYSGYSADAYQYLSQVFKFTFSYVNVVEEDLKKGGPVETEAKLLTRNEADMTSTDTQLYYGLFSRFDVSIPFYTAGTAFMVPWPDEESRLLAVIHPFQLTVWLVILITLIIMPFIFTWIPGLYEKIIINVGNNADNNINANDQQQQTNLFFIKELSDRALAIVANITGHGGSWPIRKQLFYRMLLGCWCLGSCVLVYAYSSLLISYLTIPTLKPVAKSMDDVSLRNVQNLEPIVAKNTLSTNMMAVANQSSFELNKLQKRALAFSQIFRKHPENLYTTPQQKFDLMWTGKYASIQNEILIYTLLDELNKKAGYCRFTLTAKHLDDLMDIHHVFLFRKNWRYSNAMRNKMQLWTDYGLALHWIKSYQPSAKGCLFDDYKKNAPAIRVLTLKDLSGEFVVLLMGCALSLFAFLIEKMHNYRNRMMLRAAQQV